MMMTTKSLWRSQVRAIGGFSAHCCGPHRLSRLRSSMLLLVLLGVACALAPQAWATEPYSMKPVELPTAAHLPVSLRAALDPHGVYVFTYVNGLEAPICEVYWANSVTVQDERQATKKLLYGDL